MKVWIFNGFRHFSRIFARRHGGNLTFPTAFPSRGCTPHETVSAVNLFTYMYVYMCMYTYVHVRTDTRTRHVQVHYSMYGEFRACGDRAFAWGLHSNALYGGIDASRFVRTKLCPGLIARSVGADTTKDCAAVWKNTAPHTRSYVFYVLVNDTRALVYTYTQTPGKCSTRACASPQERSGSQPGIQ